MFQPGARPSSGSGSTINISRRGLLFKTEDEVEIGTKVKMTIRMGPGPAADSADVSLHVQGIAVRTEPGKVAVSIKKHRLSPVAPPPLDARL